MATVDVKGLVTYLLICWLSTRPVSVSCREGGWQIFQSSTDILISLEGPFLLHNQTFDSDNDCAA